MIDILKWLLEVEIRWKNGLNTLIALVSVVVFYIAARHGTLFGEVAARGNGAIAAMLVVVLVIAFLTASLITGAVVSVMTHRRVAREKVRNEYEKLKRIDDTLASTSGWQRSFLLRFVSNNITQIKEWEVGAYEALWGPEVEVLCAKGIIRRYPGGVLEIVPEYLQHLHAFWDPVNKTLKSIDVT